MGLRDPLLKHRPWRRRRLERLGREGRNPERLESLVGELQEGVALGRTLGLCELGQPAGPCCSRGAGGCGLPGNSRPEGVVSDAPGYLVEQRKLQRSRPAAPGEEESWQYHWDYYQGRI